MEKAEDTSGRFLTLEEYNKWRAEQNIGEALSHDRKRGVWLSWKWFTGVMKWLASIIVDQAGHTIDVWVAQHVLMVSWYMSGKCDVKIWQAC